MNRKIILQEFKELLSLSPDADKIEKQNRGRQFEKLMDSWLKLENLDPRIRITPNGEEIDGSFILNSKTYLFETKWHSKQISASSIFTFKGKVDGKLVGTVGFFISISGYSPNAVEALIKGKDINVLLFDGDDLKKAMSVEGGFQKACEIKLRAATEEGIVFYSLESHLIEYDRNNNRVISEQQNLICTPKVEEYNKSEVIIITEGSFDRIIMVEFISLAITKTLSPKKVRLFHGTGGTSVIQLISKLLIENPDNQIIAVIDNDMSGEVLQNNLKNLNIIQSTNVRVFRITFIDLLNRVKKSIDDNEHFQPPINYPIFINRLQRLIKKSGIESFTKIDNEFKRFWQFLISVLNDEKK